MKKLNKKKNNFIHARADAGFVNVIKSYAEASGLPVGVLVRAALQDYIINHPIKKVDDPLKGLRSE